MEELLGRVKQGFWTFTNLNFKWKHEHKQWEHHFAKGGNSLAKRTNFARRISPCQIFARGFSLWCEIWQFRTMKKPPCEISQGGIRHLAKMPNFARWLFTLRNLDPSSSPLAKCLWNPCFETLLMIFHCRFSKIFCLIFSFVNTYFTLVINQWKGCFCNNSCNLACYCL